MAVVVLWPLRCEQTEPSRCGILGRNVRRRERERACTATFQTMLLLYELLYIIFSVPDIMVTWLTRGEVFTLVTLDEMK